jgi:hypothetical protein
MIVSDGFKAPEEAKNPPSTTNTLDLFPFDYQLFV